MHRVRLAERQRRELLDGNAGAELDAIIANLDACMAENRRIDRELAKLLEVKTWHAPTL